MEGIDSSSALYCCISNQRALMSSVAVRENNCFEKCCTDKICKCKYMYQPLWWEVTGIMRAWICVSVVPSVVHTVSSGKYC